MGKRDHIKRVFKGFSTKASASELAPTTSGIALEPRVNEPTDRVSGASSTVNQDPPVRDLWGLAFEKLSEEDRIAMSHIVSGSELDILKYLHAAAVKKRTDCEDRRWKIELNGKQVTLRSVAEKIIVWLDKFKQIGDIAVNFDPVHASLPWAGIRFFLEIAVTESQKMGALLTGVEKMTFLIGRCQIYESLYLKGGQSEHEDWKPAVASLTSALVTLYAAILSFLACAIRTYRQGTISRALCAILNPDEVVDFLKDCKALDKNLKIEFDNCERIHTRQSQASSEDQIHKLKQILADFQLPILRIDSRVAALFENLESSERVRILEWISGICYEDNHKYACQGRTSGTGEWLLQHERYRKWRTSDASMILWLHGDPGAGKTKLVSTVVDDLLENFEQLSNNEAFAYFYCDRNESDRREPAMILSSFVRQLSTPRNNDVIPRCTVQMYNRKRQRAFASGKLGLEESQTLLADLFQIYPQITLVVDALDECDKWTRLDFIDKLNKLIVESSKPVKILISSRRDTDIQRCFEGGPNLEIRAIDNRDDITTFVDHEITTNGKYWQVEISVELKELICSTLVEMSGGMFQWVALQIATLRDLFREGDIRSRLGKLPDTLKTTYDELYHKIQSQKESTPIIAKRAFQWVMCSCWPLTPAELVTAVCQDPDTDEIDKIDININAVLGACQNLLVVDQQQGVCRFSHLSVQEYLEGYHWSSCETDYLVGNICLSLLINHPPTPNQDGQPLKKKGRDNSVRAHDVLEYACLNWVTHVQRLEEKGVVEDRLTALLKLFLGSMDQSSLAYQNWYAMVRKYFQNYGSRRYEIYHELIVYRDCARLSPCSRASLAIVTFGFYTTILDWWTTGFADLYQKNSSGDSLLVLAALRGSVSIVENLLKQGADVNAADGEYRSALQAASYSGHDSLVHLLLNKGADINASGGKYGSALQAASFSSYESVVQLLVEKGADVNASGGNYGSALQLASYHGSELIVQLLLNKGAEIDAPEGMFGSALQAATDSGHESVVKLLLDKGANFNMPGGNSGSTLQEASFFGYESEVQLLLDKGADVNASNRYYGRALQAASCSGHEPVVQLLLGKGADVNASDEKFSSALQMASYYGHESVVQLLLDNGADVNASGGQLDSALQVASLSGHQSVVQLLLDKGADVNAAGGKYGSALQTASHPGRESIVELLLNKGADVNAAGGEYGSALQVASYCGHESVIQLLLDKGADVNAKLVKGSGGQLDSALQAASFSGHKSVVQLLLDKGADVNAPGGYYSSALEAASFSGHESVVQLLLDKGSDVNASGGYHGSALRTASCLGRESIAQLLLNKGAEVNKSDEKFSSALQMASYYGHEPVVQLLLLNGADVHASGGQYDSALQSASFFGHLSVVQLLLDKGADVNASSGYYSRALEAASFSGHQSVVQLLLDKGADVNASGGQFDSALKAASFSGHKLVVQLLLNRGVDVNASGGYYGSALQVASFYGHESVVKLLLDKGADVNAPGGYFDSALQAVSFSGHRSVVQLLLDNGADVNASGGQYGNALQAASFSGHKSVVQLLLEKGADVNASGGGCDSALDIASSHGYEAIVRLLQAAMKSQ